MSPSRDVAIGEIAARQHGIVTAGQLGAAGLSRAAISKRVRGGRLSRVHRGVYAVGYSEPSLEARWMAAVLACGPGAALSHRSAAALWGLLRPFAGAIDVSVPTQAGRALRPGIRIHRRASLGRDGISIPGGGRVPPAVTIRDRVPVTSPWLTIEDLRGAVPPKLHRRAVRQAELQRLTLAPQTRGDRTRSDLERDFLRLCRRNGLPPPEVNVKIGRWTIDFLWRAERLAIETDSWAYHRGSVAFEDDHARDLDLRSRGFEVRRFTGRQLEEEPERVAADVADGLAER